MCGLLSPLRWPCVDGENELVLYVVFVHHLDEFYRTLVVQDFKLRFETTVSEVVVDSFVCFCNFSRRAISEWLCNDGVRIVVVHD